MALTEYQDIPKKPEVKEPWTIKRLLPFASVTSSIAKVFASPLDILLGYLVFILGIAELIGRNVSWFIWVFTVLILAADIFERRISTQLDIKKEKKPRTNK